MSLLTLLLTTIILLSVQKITRLNRTVVRKPLKFNFHNTNFESLNWTLTAISASSLSVTYGQTFTAFYTILSDRHFCYVSPYALTKSGSLLKSITNFVEDILLGKSSYLLGSISISSVKSIRRFGEWEPDGADPTFLAFYNFLGHHHSANCASLRKAPLDWT